ncbi:unnamed protein product [Amoebophrya sp. A120]|nr:unnamed protein product [Amoebophrya sp. A120]|eukprot:GSA120T00014525001.1
MLSLSTSRGGGVAALPAVSRLDRNYRGRTSSARTMTRRSGGPAAFIRYAAAVAALKNVYGYRVFATTSSQTNDVKRSKKKVNASASRSRTATVVKTARSLGKMGSSTSGGAATRATAAEIVVSTATTPESESPQPPAGEVSPGRSTTLDQVEESKSESDTFLQQETARPAGATRGRTSTASDIATENTLITLSKADLAGLIKDLKEEILHEIFAPEGDELEGEDHSAHDAGLIPNALSSSSIAVPPEEKDYHDLQELQLSGSSSSSSSTSSFIEAEKVKNNDPQTHKPRWWRKMFSRNMNDLESGGRGHDPQETMSRTSSAQRRSLSPDENHAAQDEFSLTSIPSGTISTINSIKSIDKIAHVQVENFSFMLSLSLTIVLWSIVLSEILLLVFALLYFCGSFAPGGCCANVAGNKSFSHVAQMENKRVAQKMEKRTWAEKPIEEGAPVAAGRTVAGSGSQQPGGATTTEEAPATAAGAAAVPLFYEAAGGDYAYPGAGLNAAPRIANNIAGSPVLAGGSSPPPEHKNQNANISASFGAGMRSSITEAAGVDRTHILKRDHDLHHPGSAASNAGEDKNFYATPFRRTSPQDHVETTSSLDVIKLEPRQAPMKTKRFTSEDVETFRKENAQDPAGPPPRSPPRTLVAPSSQQQDHLPRSSAALQMQTKTILPTTSQETNLILMSVGGAGPPTVLEEQQEQHKNLLPTTTMATNFFSVEALQKEEPELYYNLPSGGAGTTTAAPSASNKKPQSGTGGPEQRLQQRGRRSGAPQHAQPPSSAAAPVSTYNASMVPAAGTKLSQMQSTVVPKSRSRTPSPVSMTHSALVGKTQRPSLHEVGEWVDE